MVALAVQLRALGAEVRVSPPDEELKELLARVGVPVAPFAKPWRSWAARPSTAEERVGRVDEFAAEFIAATPWQPRDATRSWRAACCTSSHGRWPEKVAILHRFAIFCPSLLDARWDALVGAPINTHRASIDLPPVDDVREFPFTDHPWVVPGEPPPRASGRLSGAEVHQMGAVARWPRAATKGGASAGRRWEPHGAVGRDLRAGRR